MNSLGIDISSYDGVIDWPTVASRGIKWATIRASWNKNGADNNYSINMQGARSNLIKAVSYHWYVPRVDPIAQANWFVDHSGTVELPRMIDLEDTTFIKAYRGIATELRRFLDQVCARTNERCMIYTSPSYINNYLTGSTWLSEYPLIIAHWDVAYPSYKLWQRTNWRAWQYTGKGDAKYYGIPQCTDCSLYVWNGHV